MMVVRNQVHRHPGTIRGPLRYGSSHLLPLLCELFSFFGWVCRVHCPPILARTHCTPCEHSINCWSRCGAASPQSIGSGLILGCHSVLLCSSAAGHCCLFAVFMFIFCLLSSSRFNESRSVSLARPSRGRCGPVMAAMPADDFVP